MTPEQFKNINLFFDVLKRTGTKISDVEKANLGQILSNLPVSFTEAAVKPLRTPKVVLFNALNAFRSGKKLKELAEVILSPEARQQLLNIRKLSPKSEQAIESLGIFLSTAIGQELEEDIRRETFKLNQDRPINDGRRLIE